MGATLLTREEMEREYGELFKERRSITLEESNVPRQLWPLIPYAEFWGLPDDLEREMLVRRVGRPILENLVAAIRMFDDELDEWLAGPEAASVRPSKEYIAFSAMRMAADFA